MERYATVTLKNESLRILRDVGRRPLPHQQPLCPIRPKAVTKWTHSCCSAQREMLTLTLRRSRIAREFFEIRDPVGSASAESALQIGDQIVAVFKSDREPQKVGGDARLPLCFGGHAAVSHGR